MRPIQPDEFGFGRVEFESTLTAPLDDVLQTGLQCSYRPLNVVDPCVVVQLGVIGVEMHFDTMFLDDGFYICCINDVEQWTEDCTLRQTEKHDHGAGFVWPDLEDLKTSNQE